MEPPTSYPASEYANGCVHVLRIITMTYHEPPHPTARSKVAPPVPVPICVSDPKKNILLPTKGLAMARRRSQQRKFNDLSFNLIEVLDDWHQDQGAPSFRAVVTLEFGSSRPERIPWTRFKTPNLQREGDQSVPPFALAVAAGYYFNVLLDID